MLSPGEDSLSPGAPLIFQRISDLELSDTLTHNTLAVNKNVSDSMPRGNPTLRATIRLDPELLKEAEFEAKQSGDTFSDLARDGIKREIAARRRKRKTASPKTGADVL